MPTLRDRPRSVCPDCGARHRAHTAEVLFHQRLRGGGVWEWYQRKLCPPCAAAQLDYWRGASSSKLERLVAR